jgi:hypothetical protein
MDGVSRAPRTVRSRTPEPSPLPPPAHGSGVRPPSREQPATALSAKPAPLLVSSDPSLRAKIMRLPLIAAVLIALSAPAHAECLPLAKAVRSAHRGSHATWRLRLPGHVGTKCWFAQGSTNLPRVRQGRVDSRRGTVHAEAGRETDGQTERASSEVKASTADGSDESPARLRSQETSVPTEPGRCRS